MSDITTDITTGGLRDRLIADALHHLVVDSLDALGWFDEDRQHDPIVALPGPLASTENIPVNALTLTREDIPVEIVELGSNLGEHRHVFWIDFYAENDPLGEHVVGDIRDILRGRFPSIGREAAVLQVHDRTLDVVPEEPAFVCEIEDVVVERAPRDTTNPGERHWYFVRCEVIDEH